MKKSAGDAAKMKFKTDRYAKKYAWKLVTLASSKPPTEDARKKTYHFCQHHNNGAGAWVIHHPNNCDKRDSKEEKPVPNNGMSLTKVLQTVKEVTGDTLSDKDK